MSDVARATAGAARARHDTPIVSVDTWTPGDPARSDAAGRPRGDGPLAEAENAAPRAATATSAGSRAALAFPTDSATRPPAGLDRRLSSSLRHSAEIAGAVDATMIVNAGTARVVAHYADRVEEVAEGSLAAAASSATVQTMLPAPALLPESPPTEGPPITAARLAFVQARALRYRDPCAALSHLHAALALFGSCDRGLDQIEVLELWGSVALDVQLQPLLIRDTMDVALAGLRSLQQQPSHLRGPLRGSLAELLRLELRVQEHRCFALRRAARHQELSAAATELARVAARLGDNMLRFEATTLARAAEHEARATPRGLPGRHASNSLPLAPTAAIQRSTRLAATRRAQDRGQHQV